MGGGGGEITTDHAYQEREQCQQYKKYTQKTRVWVGGGGGGEITTDHVYQEREQCQQYKKYTEKTGWGWGRGDNHRPMYIKNENNVDNIKNIQKRRGCGCGGWVGEITTDHVYQEREQCQQYKKYTEKTGVGVGGGGGGRDNHRPCISRTRTMSTIQRIYGKDGGVGGGGGGGGGENHRPCISRTRTMPTTQRIYRKDGGVGGGGGGGGERRKPPTMYIKDENNVNNTKNIQKRRRCGWGGGGGGDNHRPCISRTRTMPTI